LVLADLWRRGSAAAGYSLPAQPVRDTLSRPAHGSIEGADPWPCSPTASPC